MRKSSLVNQHARTLGLLVAGWAFAGMSCGDELPRAVSSIAGPIQGGTNDTTHTFAVGIVSQMNGGYALCSGALLAPNLVATARHCVAAVGDEAIICPQTKFGAVRAASTFAVTTDADLGSAKTQVGVRKVIVPSGSDQTSVCGNDIALLILSKNISLPAYVTPVLSPPMTNHSLYSTTVTAVGYGVTSPSDSTGSTAGIRRIKQGIKLACIPNDKSFTDCFPSHSSEITAAEFMTGNGTCEGDSGSDAYEQDNFNAGRWVGFGVLSRGGATSTTCLGGVYTRFDAWSALVIGAAKEAATAGGYALPAWADPSGGADGGTGGGDAGLPLDAGSKPETGAGTGGNGGTPPRDAGNNATEDARPSADGASTPPRDGGTSVAEAGAPATGGTGGSKDPGGGTGGGHEDARGGHDAGTSVMPPEITHVGQSHEIVGNLGCAIASDDLAPSWAQALAALGLTVVAVRRARRKGAPAAERETPRA
jgi:hypothetical protein